MTAFCPRSNAIYLMECILCNKQHVREAKTSFNIRLNNHQKDVKKVEEIMACKHIQLGATISTNMQNLPLLIS